ncbi:MAG: hypothetical protein U0822_27290 [Anaerolineae bacterium]
MSTQDSIPPTRTARAEALNLSASILANIELSDIPLTNIALKACRLARLLNEFDYQKIMQYEAGGYPSSPEGVSPHVWALGVQAGRSYQQKNSKTGEIKTYMYTESISQLEETLKISAVALSAAQDPDISVASSNPNQFVAGGIVNRAERGQIRASIAATAERLAMRRSMIYNYALQRHYELKFSGVAEDIFTRIRSRVDKHIGIVVPEAVHKLSAVYDNLLSENPENWSLAVHSCRRILQDLADALFPATEEVRLKIVQGKEQRVRLGNEQYINRLIAYIEDHCDSERFEHLVGSHLDFIGERLDSVFQAAQKGSHATIVSREEADRYVVYTYLLVGDILSLTGVDQTNKAS